MMEEGLAKLSLEGEASLESKVEVAEPFRFTFEIAWEVAHKGNPHSLFYRESSHNNLYILVGGIHTVLRSKAAVTTSELGDQYYMIGPYHEPTVKLEVEVMEPEFPVAREVVESMRKEGVNVSSKMDALQYEMDE